MRSGCRRSSPRRWPTSATTLPIIPRLIRCSARWTISIALLAAAHARGLKLILDFVPNHTSDQHPWFVESRASRNNPKRDWYIWRDPAPDGGPPNNWLSEFGGSAWEFDAASGQYYYHAFLTAAARPELAQSRRRRARCTTSCGSGSARRRRLSRRRDLASDEGRRLPRQSAQPGFMTASRRTGD